MTRYYIDTCIWIDFIEDRADNDIIVNCIKNEDTIVVSQFLLRELYKHVSSNSTTVMFTILYSKGLIMEINSSTSQDLEALSISKNRDIPFGDALHAILARDSNATLISRDKHFLKLKDICNIELF